MFAVAGAALVAAAVTAVVVANSGPATASPWDELAGKASCDCVVKNTKTGEYRAVFGYDNPSDKAGKIAVGDRNRVELFTPSSAHRSDGLQVTQFEPGHHKAAFATGWVSKDTEVTWTVGSQKVQANWAKPSCGKDVSLPAGGNGSGPLVALLGSLLVAGGVVLFRRRRMAKARAS
jgi:hypothetical protein